jgi:lipopolysaccharide export system protein LptA
MMRVKLKTNLIKLCILFYVPLCFALPSDEKEKLYISAASAQVNRTTGIGVYEGDVKIDRGTTHIIAEKLTTYNNKQNQFTKAVLAGKGDKLAEYNTVPELNKPVLTAKANIIEYYPQKHYVILMGNAIVTQGTNSITGPHLEYDTEKQIMVSKNNDKATDNRTHIVIQPDELSLKGK